MSEPARIRPVPDAQPPSESEAPQSLTASGAPFAWQDILHTAAGASPEVAASTAIAYVAHEMGETVRAYIGQKGQTDRARIKAQGTPPQADDGSTPEG